MTKASGIVQPRRAAGSCGGGVLRSLATLTLACTLLMAACSTTVERVSDASELKALGFLQAGVVTREEVLGRLGTPAFTYEGGRIAMYVLRRQRDRFEVSASLAAQYRLVVVYRPDEVVDRWSLVDLTR